MSAISIRLPVSLWARIDAIAQRETAQRKAAGKKPPVISRNALVACFLDLSCDDYEKREGQVDPIAADLIAHEEAANAREKKKR